MPITKQRILQAGVVALAMTMLGGYVVYSQRAQQPQQIAQSSKGRVGISSLGESVSKSGTNPANQGASMVFLDAAGRPVATSTVPVGVVTTGHVSKVMMSGSKSAAVVRGDQVVRTLAPTSPTNPASRVMMPSSKLIVLSRPAGASNSTVANTNAVSQPVPAK